MIGGGTDDEGKRLANLCDEEWADHVRRLERQHKPTTGQGGRTLLADRRVLTIAAIVVVVGVLVAIVVPRIGGSNRPSAPASSAPVAAGPFGNSPAAHWMDAAAALVLPTARPQGSLSTHEVQGALARTRTYLLTARASTGVLTHHSTAQLKTLVDPRALSSSFAKKHRVQETLGATFLAPDNRLAAPVRLLGTMTDNYVPARDHVAAHLVVSANVVWAYALSASYPLAPIPDKVVALHERVEFGYYFEPDLGGPNARPSAQLEDTLWFDTDCGYYNQSLLGLPRVNDPDAAPNAGTGADPRQAFDPNSPVTGSTHQCKPAAKHS